CLTLDPDNVDTHLSIAGALLTQDDLTGAKTHFETALKQMKRTSPYWSYTYSMLGDIALKQRNPKQALEMYAKSLEYNAANVNSLIGKGVILETQGNYQGAAEAYTSALAVEPLNVIARQRLINLEPEYLTDEEILTALKQRYAVKPEQTELTDANRDLFLKIHRAEQRRGIDYLKNKYGKNTQDYIVTLNKGTDFAREILTLHGYNALQKNMGQDAVAAFRRLGVPVQQVFELRDKQGNPVFTKDSTLTEEGFAVYTQVLAGKQEFLRPGQMVPLTQAQKQKINARVQALTQKGYAEISHSELKLLETKTLCSEETLKNKLGVYYLPIGQKHYRYLVRTTDNDALKTVPYYYVMQARHKRNPKIEVPKNELVEYYDYYGYTICLSDGNLTLADESSSAK
ncbi:MAG: tetratricopeptide repeat protein, partial [Elusimicrobiaceae bacterium]|nr:tetratricopeptide repeat protein [Elusimicrobiaceae bacterium]